MAFAPNILACNHCPRRERVNGIATCTIDGRTIIQHANAGECPHPDGSRFPVGEELVQIEVKLAKPKTPPDPDVSELMATMGLGDKLESLLKVTGAKRMWEAWHKAKDCEGCKRRKEALNRIGEWIKAKLA